MELDYKNYFTKDNLRVRGYDLAADGVLDTSHFDSLDNAIDDFMDNTLRIIYNLFVEYKGREFANAFFTDMARNDLTGTALDYKQRLNRALIEQAIFIYDNGDVDADSSYQERSYRSPYAPKAAKELWDILYR